MYQGRVVLVALAAELALKYLWETENAGGAPGDHDLLKCFNRLLDHRKDEIRRKYERRVTDPLEEEWRTVDQLFEICRNSFVDWRYIVEEGNYPNYIMRATYLKEATLSVVDVGPDTRPRLSSIWVVPNFWRANVSQSQPQGHRAEVRCA